MVEAYQASDDVERYANVAGLEEVISVEEALSRLQEAERQRGEAVAQMDELLAELGHGR